MYDQISEYSDKLTADCSAEPQHIAFAAQDDVIISGGDPKLAIIATDIISHLNCLAILVATPSLPFADFLLRRTDVSEHEIIPRDTETRTFLHTIPILRQGELGSNPAKSIAALLGKRKGVIVEGLGIIASGNLTVEQAYINWSSLFHSTYIKYLEDLLEQGFLLPGEDEAFRHFRQEWLPPLSSVGLDFRQGPLLEKIAILEEITRVGRYTVQRHLVDSFFGNISYSDKKRIYISQTAASLDKLSGCLEQIPFENSSTVGITASSELAAHYSIYQMTGCRAILHGHPRFAVIMSMICPDKLSCIIKDCWKDCPKVRFLGNTPVVAGEIGSGGLAKNVPPVIGQTGSAVVYGHGVFSMGMNDFRDAFQGLVDVENWCRSEYFRLFDEKYAE